MWLIINPKSVWCLFHTCRTGNTRRIHLTHNFSLASIRALCWRPHILPLGRKSAFVHWLFAEFPPQPTVYINQSSSKVWVLATASYGNAVQYRWRVCAGGRGRRGVRWRKRRMEGPRERQRGGRDDVRYPVLCQTPDSPGLCCGRLPRPQQQSEVPGDAPSYTHKVIPGCNVWWWPNILLSLLAQNLENEEVLGSNGNSSFNNLFKIRCVFIGVLWLHLVLPRCEWHTQMLMCVPCFLCYQ